MGHRLSIFSKVLILILAMLIPTLGLYVYSYRESISLIEESLRDEKYDNLWGVYNGIVQYVGQLSLFSYTFLADPLIEEYRDLYFSREPYHSIRVRRDIMTRLSFQLGVFGPEVFFAFYDPLGDDVISISTEFDYDGSYFAENYSRRWQLQARTDEDSVREELFFVSHFDLDILESKSSLDDLILETGFSVRKIHILMNGGQDSSNNRFLLLEDGRVISDKDQENRLVSAIHREILAAENSGHHDITLTTGDTSLLVQFIPLRELQAYLVDYASISQIISPLEINKNLFYLAVIFLLATGIVAAFALYRNVQVPISLLIEGFERVRGGDFTTRLKKVKNREFKFLVSRFNSMTGKIESLIQDVYEERIHTQEAVVKQLQSQINPHFLYNSLFYIKSMARMGNEEAVVSMSLHLAEYFRYTTRTENPLVPLRDELEMVTNYLTIQKMRISRLTFSIEVDEKMGDIEIPRLIIQPVIENAVIHGIEKNPGAGAIIIKGFRRESSWRLSVIDDGGGITEEELSVLRRKLGENLEGGIGCGTWNVNRRLKRLYPRFPGLVFELARDGLLTVSMDFPIP